MTYWTVLWITILSGPLHGSKSYLIYESKEQCVEAHWAVIATLPYDFMAKCEETDTLSNSVRPKPNPRYSFGNQ
jgi:hypothetical protein